MKDDTRLVHSGRNPHNHYGMANLPAYRTSTVLYPSLAAFRARAEGERRWRGVRYGAYGTPITLALADAVAELEGGAGSVVTATGLSAVTIALTALVGQGDHILVVDSVYSPTREFCDTLLKRFGVETTYFPAAAGLEIADRFTPRTRLVFCESPGSLTFEVQDLPAIAAAARPRGIHVLADSTWGTPLFYKALDHGADIAVQAGTKYIAGHSDLVLGIVTARTEALFRQVKETAMVFGEIAGPEECFLTLRGLRSLGARLRQQEASALKVARWLQGRPEVRRVLYPALPEDPGHALWQRDFQGASSLFGVLLHPVSRAQLDRMVDGYRLFGIGASWGGFESLVMPAEPASCRTAAPWNEAGCLLRYHIGLEDPDDLIGDLAEGLARLA